MLHFRVDGSSTFLSNVCVVQGINLDKVLDAGLYISEALQRPSCSKVAQARGKSRL